MKKILFLFFILSTGCTKQDNVDETQYLQTEEGQSTKDDDLYYYQNWGWGGNGNGWYNATDVNTSQGDYQYGRENFYIYPN